MRICCTCEWLWFSIYTAFSPSQDGKRMTSMVLFTHCLTSNHQNHFNLQSRNNILTKVELQTSQYGKNVYQNHCTLSVLKGTARQLQAQPSSSIKRYGLALWALHTDSRGLNKVALSMSGIALCPVSVVQISSRTM